MPTDLKKSATLLSSLSWAAGKRSCVISLSLEKNCYCYFWEVQITVVDHTSISRIVPSIEKKANCKGACNWLSEWNLLSFHVNSSDIEEAYEKYLSRVPFWDVWSCLGRNKNCPREFEEERRIIFPTKYQNFI